MTLVIALRCTDGLVMASDGMSTEAAPLGAGLIAKHETGDKIVIHKDLMWGASGSVGVKQVVEAEIERDYGNWFQRNISAVEFRRRLVIKIQPILKEQYRLVGEITNNQVPFTNFIFGVRLAEGFYLLNIEANCAGEVVECRHFATGSAAKTGQALLRRLRNQEWDVRTGLVIAYRTLNDAIHIEPSGIGPPIYLARYYMSGQQNKIEKIQVESPEYKQIEDTARAWTILEQEALESLKAGKLNAGQQAAQEIPKPG